MNIWTRYAIDFVSHGNRDCNSLVERQPITAAALCAVLLITTACRNDVEEPQTGSRVRVLEAPPQPLTAAGVASEAVSIDPRLRPSVQAAQQDLATMLNAEPETIDVVEGRFVTWPDSSLGCPRPNLEYMQVLTDGVLIVLTQGGTSYHYHGSREGRPFYCKQPRKPVVGQPGEADR